MFSIKETVAWARAALRRDYKILALVSLVNAIPVLIIFALGMIDGVLARTLTALVAIVSVVVSYLTMTASNYVASTAIMGGDLSRHAIWERTKSAFVPVIVISFFGLLFSLAFLPTLIGVPIASLFVVFATPAFFVEQKSGLDALAISVGYVRASFWKLLAFAVLTLIVILVPLMIVGVIASAIFGMPVSEGEFSGSAADLVVNLFTYAYSMPVMMVAMYAAYRSARAAAPEVSPEVFAKRRTFVKACAIIGPIFGVLALGAGLLMFFALSMRFGA